MAPRSSTRRFTDSLGRRHRSTPPTGRRRASSRMSAVGASRSAVSLGATDWSAAASDCSSESVTWTPGIDESAPTSVATTGTPHIAASMAVPGMPSMSLVIRTTSAAWSTGSDIVDVAEEHDPSGPQGRRAGARRAARSGPSPAITSTCLVGACRPRRWRGRRASPAVRLPTKATIGRSGQPEASAGCPPLLVVGRSERAGVAGVRDDRRAVVSEAVQPLQRLGRGGPQRHDANGPADLHSGDPPVEVVADPATRIADAAVHERAPGEPEGDRAGRQRGRAVGDHEVDIPRRPAEGEERRRSERTAGPTTGSPACVPVDPGSVRSPRRGSRVPGARRELRRLDLRSSAVVGRRDDEHRRALPRPQARGDGAGVAARRTAPSTARGGRRTAPSRRVSGRDGTQAEVAGPRRRLGGEGRAPLRRRPLPVSAAWARDRTSVPWRSSCRAETGNR